MVDETRRVVLLEGHRKRAFYANVVAELDAEFLEATPAEVMDGPGERVDLLLVDDETWPYTAAAICASRRAGVPTLHLVDGIVEWKNTWNNPRQATEDDGMPLFQPVLADKIACMGRSQARLLASWGNEEKIEITGSPRFDRIRPDPPRERVDGSARVLVATARTPAFTPEQRSAVEASLRDLRDWFDAGPVIDGSSLRPVWRLTDGLGESIGVRTEGDLDLLEQLHDVDAVITTPSTLQVEAMLAGRPVALLDYLNLPHFVPAAWTVSAPGHIADVLPQLGAPDAARLQYQQAILDDTVACRGAAAGRVAELADRMIAVGRSCRHDGRSLRFPARMLPEEPDTTASAARELDPIDLHPRHPILAETDVASLQAEVAQLRRVIRNSPWQRLYRFATAAQRRFGSRGPRRAR